MKFYRQVGGMKLAENKTFSFDDLLDLADPDGVLRNFMAIKCRILDCPAEEGYTNSVVKREIETGNSMFGMKIENVHLFECQLFNVPDKTNSFTIKEIDNQIDQLLDLRNTINGKK